MFAVYMCWCCRFGHSSSYHKAHERFALQARQLPSSAILHPNFQQLATNPFHDRSSGYLGHYNATSPSQDEQYRRTSLVAQNDVETELGSFNNPLFSSRNIVKKTASFFSPIEPYRTVQIPQNTSSYSSLSDNSSATVDDRPAYSSAWSRWSHQGQSMLPGAHTERHHEQVRCRLLSPNLYTFFACNFNKWINNLLILHAFTCRYFQDILK